ncbi:MAG: hypothetical protein GXZ11_07475 [Tissierellia bacterium]|nr:hypothetical protein [Tissierellia bacterium]
MRIPINVQLEKVLVTKYERVVTTIPHRNTTKPVFAINFSSVRKTSEDTIDTLDDLLILAIFIDLDSFCFVEKNLLKTDILTLVSIVLEGIVAIL